MDGVWLNTAQHGQIEVKTKSALTDVSYSPKLEFIFSRKMLDFHSYHSTCYWSVIKQSLRPNKLKWLCTRTFFAACTGIRSVVL